MPDELIRFQPRHLEQMGQHIKPMTVRQLGQFNDSPRNQTRGFERTAVSRH